MGEHPMDTPRNRPTMTEPDDERAFVAAVRQSLDASVEAMPSRTTYALQRMRREALAQAQEGTTSGAASWWRPFWVGGAVTAAGLAALLWWHSAVPVLEGPLVLAPEDMEALVTLEAVDIVDDLEFYEWLASDERAT